MTTDTTAPGAADAPTRLEGRAKTTGHAHYAADHAPPGLLHARPVPAAVARGRIVAVDASAALAVPGVRAVLTHENAPRLHRVDDPVLRVLQGPEVPHRGWLVAVAVAETPEAAAEAAETLEIHYHAEPHDVLLTPGHARLRRPDQANGGYAPDVDTGDFPAAYAAAEVRLDLTYRLEGLHNHPMEPHTTTAVWDGDRLTVHDSNQGSTTVRDTLAALFGIDAGGVQVITEHVGGGFGSKGTPRPVVVLAAMAARATGAPVRLALPRRQMAATVGHRAPSVQRLRVGADRDGRLHALGHDAANQTSTVAEFAEQSATVSRIMYAVPNLHSAHQVAPLDVPTPSWMRAPGECPGMYALESAMDELATACGVDPVELRLRNEPETEPAGGRPFSTRRLADCLREGARRFGWERRDPRPRARRDGRLLVGTGVAASLYPVIISPSTAEAAAEPDGTFRVAVNATDIGTGARTVLAQLAAETLGVPLERVRMVIGRSTLPPASLAGGSSGTSSWGWAVVKACRALRGRLDDAGGAVPDGGLSARADTADDVRDLPDLSRNAFGAQFAEVAVDEGTGEVRVRRLLGVFAAGRIINARTARSQFVGGMVMGLGMALSEGTGIDPAFGDFAASDLASYHVPVNADVPEVEAHWLPETDRGGNPMGSKGIGEIGIVGTAAAVANAVHHATGVRVRDLPIRPDALLPAEPAPSGGG